MYKSEDPEMDQIMKTIKKQEEEEKKEKEKPPAKKVPNIKCPCWDSSWKNVS